MQKTTRELLDRLYQQDKRALSRLMTYVDNRHEDVLEILSEVVGRGGRALRIGITGPPGAGKSTLVDKLIAKYREENKKVGVVAIDPSSPFSGGAVLGDRIRMQEHNADEDVFIRSLGSRGAHGGLSRATRDIVHLLDAFGKDVIIVETVGVGQTELDIMAIADTTVVVLVPESGDTIQTMKAGLMEIADVFVVNKADREGADRIFAELKALTEMYSQSWQVPVLKSVASFGKGVTEIVRAVEDHVEYQKNRSEASSANQKLVFFEMISVLTDELREILENKFKKDPSYQDTLYDLQAGKLNSYEVVREVLKKIKFIDP